MKQLAFLIFLSIGYQAYAQTEKGIHFEKGLSWQQIKEKARAEKKYIFLDVYATWCGPCKQMDQKIYVLDDIANYANEHFISVKVQFDTTKSDNEEVRNWYEEAHIVGEKYKVSILPTFLFFSPDGVLLHRGVGFQSEKAFLTTLQHASNPAQQMYTLLDVFQKGHLDYIKMPELAVDLKRSGETKLGYEVANCYIEKYLFKLDEKELYTKRNIEFIGSNIRSSNDSAFAFIFDNSDKVNVAVDKGYSRYIIDRIILKEDINPLLTKWKNDSLKNIGKHDWAKMKTTIKKKYGREYAERNVLVQQIKWYTKAQQWEAATKYNVTKIDKFGLDTVANGSAYVNNMVYETIFLHNDNRSALKKAITWMKIISEGHPYDAVYLDTYANLLYKNGDVKNAVSLEEKACALDTNEKEIVDNLKKMKNGQPTWQ